MAKAYPEARCDLVFENPFQLLVATILSAQTTDQAVNKVCLGLFKHYPDPLSLSRARAAKLEKELRPLGLQKTKARNLRSAAQVLLAEFDGRVPGEMEALRRIPGVGRKTARVLLGECFGQPGIVVDTHMGRLARRLGFSSSEDPLQVEKDLDRWVPERERTRFSHRMIRHGRALCKAKNPACSACFLAALCPSRV